MRIRVARGFTSDVFLPGIDVETASLTIGDVTTALNVTDGRIRIPAAALDSVDVRAGVVHCEILVNGDQRIPCDIIANPSRPNRR